MNKTKNYLNPLICYYSLKRQSFFRDLFDDIPFKFTNNKVIDELKKVLLF